MNKASKIVKIIISVICISFVVFHFIAYHHRIFWLMLVDNQLDIYPPEDVPNWVFFIQRLFTYDYELLMIIFLLIFTTLLIKKDKINVTLLCINVSVLLIDLICNIIYDATITTTYYSIICTYYLNFFHSIACALIIGETFYLFKDYKIKRIFPYVKLFFLISMVGMFIYRHIDNSSKYDFIIYHNAIVFSGLEIFEILISNKEKRKTILSIIEASITIFMLLGITLIREIYYYDNNFVNQYSGVGFKIYILRSIMIYALIILYAFRHIFYYNEKQGNS